MIFQADQLVSEKVSGAEHTKLDDNFVQMEKITDVFLEVEVRTLNFIPLGLDIKYLLISYYRCCHAAAK